MTINKIKEIYEEWSILLYFSIFVVSIICSLVFFFIPNRQAADNAQILKCSNLGGIIQRVYRSNDLCYVQTQNGTHIYPL